MSLEQTAIDRLRMASDMSLRLHKQPLVITYSGGKDSDVLLHLAGNAGIQAERRKRGLPCDWQTGDDVMHWWMEDGVLPGQLVFDGMEEDTL